MEKQKKVPYNVGCIMEEQACRFLTRRNYSIICRNYRSRYGEIDIIAARCNTLVFVEVRYRRKNSLVTPNESVDWSKIRKLKLTIRDFLYTHSKTASKYDFIRVDLCCITSSDAILENSSNLDFNIIMDIIEF